MGLFFYIKGGCGKFSVELQKLLQHIQILNSNDDFFFMELNRVIETVFIVKTLYNVV
jgi:hypothetical protein